MRKIQREIYWGEGMIGDGELLRSDMLQAVTVELRRAFLTERPPMYGRLL